MALFGFKMAALKSCGSERLITLKIQEGVTGTSWSILTNKVVKVEFWDKLWENIWQIV